MTDIADDLEEMSAKVFEAGALAMRIKIFTELHRRHDEAFLIEILDVLAPKWLEKQ